MPAREVSASVPTGRFRIDPTFRLAAAALAVLGTALVVAVVVGTTEPERVRAALVLAPAAILFLGLGIASAGVRIDFDGRVLAKRGPFTIRSLAVDEVAQVRYVPKPRTQNNFSVRLVGARARSGIRFNPEFWDRTTDLVQIARALDPEHRHDPMSQRLDDEDRAHLRRRLGG